MASLQLATHQNLQAVLAVKMSRPLLSLKNLIRISAPNHLVLFDDLWIMIVDINIKVPDKRVRMAELTLSFGRRWSSIRWKDHLLCNANRRPMPNDKPHFVPRWAMLSASLKRQLDRARCPFPVPLHWTRNGCRDLYLKTTLPLQMRNCAH